jgi:predicted ribosomally synthesized peptide with SipW-like signal peptide
MYLSKDREQAPKSSKNMIIAAAAGLAVVGVATTAYMNQEDEMDFTQLSGE